MSVVGIDFGNLNTVVAVARNKGIDVITNEVSNRATPSLVSFGEKQRYLGESAKTQEISNFKSTVAGLKRLIGRDFADPEVAEFEQKFVNCKLVEGERGDVAAHVTYAGEQRTFSMTQVAAMFFSQVKDFTSKEIKMACTDVVLSCPGWFTDRQRRSLLDAAEISGLNVLRIMNDLTASALGYGITKTDLPDVAENPNLKPRTVVFVDMGNSSYQVAVVQFVKGKLTVKSTAYDRNLGGRDFDEKIVDHYVTEFDKKYKMNIRSNPKALFRLRQGCEKVKKILSANSVTMLNVECLMDDKDVSAEVHRAEFLEWVSPLVGRLQKPLDDALAAAGISPADVDFVELVGGSTRLAVVKDFLSSYFNKNKDENKLSTTLNLDEAVARGCALQCAIISPVFKVRDFTVQDWNGYPITLAWDSKLVPAKKNGEAGEAEMEAFQVGNAIPSSKALTFFRRMPETELAEHNGHVKLDINAVYDGVALDARQLPFVRDNKIGTFTVTGIKKLAGDPNACGDGVGKATIKLKAHLDGNNLITLDSAQQIEEVLVPADEEEKKDDMETDDKKESVATLAAKGAAPPSKMKRVTRKHDLQIVVHTAGASRELVKEWHAAEGQMAASDRLVIDTAEKRNLLEEYVYYARDKLDMAWSDFITDSDRSAFSKECNEMEDWLYGDGEDATKSVYVEKLAGLKAKGDPVAARYLEAEERPRAEKFFREFANSVLINLAAEDDRYSHIDAKDLEKVKTEVQKKLDWLNTAIAKVNDAPKHVNPSVTVAQINTERESLTYFVNPILNKPKPAPKVEEKPAEPETDNLGNTKEEATEEKKEEEANMDVD
ncbi:HSP70-domain-containing protein [Rhizoclosmatium globosum]|uniref:HSP70-domain-containing protein n=1 Tax=Rhizoclosmatium globosum TaxID=329046 RepID=A0A1Y2C9S2_9FUNG|nr:HSP70-domain-containing protein [Rhizoclosmatium globosum]|eukprot:ORY43782.1 HSP70-domain-containing protein [Rhizoclosmatium globosum]